MLHPNFVILGAVIVFLGGLSYLISTLQGRIKPNRVTWFLWALAPLVAFAAEIKEGVGIQSLITFMFGLSGVLIFLASFANKKSVWKLERFDFICGALSLAGLFLWYMTKNGNIAILFGILADGLAAVPTLVKSYIYPGTENYHTYLASAIGAAITLLTISNWNFANFGFPLYILIICAIFVLFIKFQAGKFIIGLKNNTKKC